MKPLTLAARRCLALALALTPSVVIATGPCHVPDELALEGVRFPTLARALAAPGRQASIVIVGPLADVRRNRRADAAGDPARLQAALVQRLPGTGIRVESVGRPRDDLATQRALITRSVLPRRPDLVLWAVGRADARHNLPSELGHEVRAGISAMAGTDLMFLSMQYHPQSEALYRTEDHRNELRWAADGAHVPVLDRFAMISHWAEDGTIDLDSADPSRQAAAAEQTLDCVVDHLARIIADGVRAAGALDPAPPADLRPSGAPAR